MDGSTGNISGLDLAQIENDIDYIMHVDHELPMEWYLQLDKVKADLAKLVVTHADAAVKRNLTEVKYRVAKTLQETVAAVVYDATKIDSPTKKPSSISNLMEG